MDFHTIQLEVMLAALAVLVLMIDAFCPPPNERSFGFIIAGAVAAMLAYSFLLVPDDHTAFYGMIRLDAFSLYFQRIFLVATILTLLIATNDPGILRSGASAFYAIILFAATGMLFMSAANDFFILFVALELVTVSFYVMTSYLRHEMPSLEAGVKYLTLGALSSGFLVYGISFLFGTTGTTNFDLIKEFAGHAAEGNRAFLFGAMMVTTGLGFKIASVPFQVWAPDVYQGSPTPATAFLATGSKAAGFVVLMRLFLSGIFPFNDRWAALIAIFSAATILYGSLGAIPQRDIKRLMGYSSIGNAGFLLMGLAAGNALGISAMLYYLAQYAITVLCAFLAVVGVSHATGNTDIRSFAGLHRRSPLLAAALFVSMMSLAGVPPLSGSFGKFFLFAAVIERAATDWNYYLLAAVGGIAAVISVFYYVNVIREVYVETSSDELPIHLTKTIRVTLCGCMAAIVLLGVFPHWLFSASMKAVAMFGLK